MLKHADGYKMKKITLLFHALYENRKRKLKLQQTFFLAHILLSFMILIFFAAFFYHYVSNILIENEKDALESLNQSILNQVDAVINDLDITSANINYSSLMSDKLDSSFNLNITDNMLPELADLFVTINGSDIKADQINLYDWDGNEVKVGMVTNTAKVDIDSLDWTNEVKRLNGVKYIGLPYHTNTYSIASSSSDWFLSVYRTYSNQYGRKVGAIETVKRCKSIFKPIYSYQKKTSDSAAIYVYNENGSLVYPYNISDWEKQTLSYYYQVLSVLGKDSLVSNPETGHNEHLVFTTSKYSNWTYITVQQESVILNPVNHLLLFLCLIVLILLVLSIFISYYLSINITRPVKHLKHIIQRMELETLGTEQIDHYDPFYEELTELFQAFQKMSIKLKLSMNELINIKQQEMKSRSLALQTQMNPHFYYNTLSCIIVLAENEESESVINLCCNLSQIMRYITDNSSSLVTLESEIEYVEKYLYCMKVRYQTNLTCVLQIAPGLLSMKVPKLIIQPLVENAIKYGTDCIPPWTITITGKQYADHWLIDIVDSGNGFSKEAMELIQKRIDEADIDSGIPELKIDGLGLLNVYIRWKLYCKENTIFRFGNTADGHAIVSIGSKMEKEAR